MLAVAIVTTIAHRQSVPASAEMLAGSLTKENEVAREVAGFISTEGDRTNLLVTRFLEFARPLQLRLAPVELTTVLDQAVEHLERGSPHYDVAVFKNYAPEIGPLPLDADLMERVFYNLLLNAAQATAAGGAITIKIGKPKAGYTVQVDVTITGAAGIAHCATAFTPQ